MADRDPPRWHVAPAGREVAVEVPRQVMAPSEAERLAYAIIAAVREARRGPQTT